MALRRSLAAAAGLALAGAQLVAEPPVDFKALTDELRAQGVLGGAEEAVPTKLSSPTICDPSVKQHSGYLDAATGVQYFFWMFESRRSPSTDPLVLWLTGGPGCSSQLALLAENGPCTVNKDGAGTTINQYGWNSQANVIWVDQPAATGFSTGGPVVHDEDGVASNMYTFLQNFFKALPQYQNLDFYIFGESYAGHYVPAVSHYLWKQIKSGGLKVSLKGVGIGNGLTDPEEQYKWYPEMASTGGRAEGGTLEKGVITNPITLAAMKAATIPCVKHIHECNEQTSSACTTAYSMCNMGELSPYQSSGFNPYDMRIKCEVQPLCYDFSNIETFLNSKSTQDQLGVSKQWQSCNQIVNMGFQLDWMKNFHTLLPDLMLDGIRVLIYAGDMDYICNWLGNKKWTLALEWPHQADFNSAADEPYLVAGKQAGRLRAANGFHFLQVYGAGHMVPMDQPAVALNMLNEFIEGKMGANAAPLNVSVSKPADQCTGDADPAPVPLCFEGVEEILSLKITMDVKITSFSSGAGKMDLSVAGPKTLACPGVPFTKNGQEISLDLGTCGPAGATASVDIKYCSDSASMVVSVQDVQSPIPLSVTLPKVACPANSAGQEELVV